MKKVDPNIVSKWLPVFEKSLASNPLVYYTFPPINNYFLKTHLCNFCEWFSESDGSNQLPSKLVEIYDKLSNVERIGIVRKVFNPYTCLEEYELENGEYVPVIGKSFSYELTFEQLSQILGIEYVKYFDPSYYRNEQLEKIL